MVIDLDGLVENVEKLCTLPVIYIELCEALDDPEVSFVEIAAIIGSDSDLTARLLKIVNSPIFGFSQKIETLTHAMTVVGTAQLRDLVLATSIVNQFKGIPKEFIDMESFWHHSIGCGLTAKTLAIYRKEASPERFYVMGMLHDLGRLLLFLSLPEKYPDLFAQTEKGELLHDAEKKMFEFDHGDAGGALLNQWGLPDSLVEAVQFHHAPGKADEYFLEASLIHVADIITQAMELGTSGERFVPPLNPKAWDKLDLPASLLPSILNQVDRQFDDAIQMFL